MKTAPVPSALPAECGYLLLAAVGVVSIASNAFEFFGWLAARLSF